MPKNEKDEKEPLFTNLKCQHCHHQWNGFFPDGIDSNSYECPKCHKLTTIQEDIVNIIYGISLNPKEGKLSRTIEERHFLALAKVILDAGYSKRKLSKQKIINAVAKAITEGDIYE